MGARKQVPVGHELGKCVLRSGTGWASRGLKWASANGCPRDKNELHHAAQMGHEEMVRALIEMSADINKAGNDGGTPLYLAAGHDNEAVLRALIEAGADVGVAAPGSHHCWWLLKGATRRLCGR